MNITAGKYRLQGNDYGWKIEKKGAKGWRESKPAYPGNTPHALQMLAERIAQDGPDTDPEGYVQRLRKAVRDVRKAYALARAA